LQLQHDIALSWENRTGQLPVREDTETVCVTHEKEVYDTAGLVFLRYS